MTMRLRDPNTGTVVSVDDTSAKRLQAAGWKPADATSSISSASESATDDETTSKPKRRSSTRR